MGTSQNIGNLNVTVTGDAAQLVAEFNKAMDAVDTAVKKFDASTSKMGNAMEGMALRVVAGAHVYGILHREIAHVIENIDKIPGMPPRVIQSVQEARQEWAAFRAEIDVVVGKLVSLGADFGHAIGAGAAMMLGYGSGDMGEHRTGREMSNDKAKALDFGFDDKVSEARERLAEATALVTQKEKDRAGVIEQLIEEAGRLETHSKSQSINDLQDVNDKIKAEQKLAEAAGIRRTIEKEIEEANRKNNAEDAKLFGATIPKRELLNALLAREGTLRYDIYALETMDGVKSAETLEKILKLRKELLGIQERAVPLVKAEQKSWDDMGEKISGTIQGMITGGTSLRETWHTILREIEKDMVKTFLDGPLKDLFSNGLKSVFGSSAAGGGGFWTALASMFIGHAGGGNTDGPSIVGENGPELFVPSGSGLILDSSTSRALAGNNGPGGSQFYIDARGADSAGLARVEAQIRALHGSIEHRAIAAVSDFNRRLAPAY